MKLFPWRLLIAPTAAVLLSSCAAHQVPFNEADFVRSGKAGYGDVAGQVFRTDVKNEIWLQTHGLTVKLMPANAYTDEIVRRKYTNREWLARADARIQKYVRRVRTDANGNFLFTRVPVGDYYVASHYKWNYPTQSTDSEGNSIQVMADDDQWLFARAHVQSGHTTTVVGWDQGR